MPIGGRTGTGPPPMPTLSYNNRNLEISDTDLAAVKDALDAFVRGVAMEPHLAKVPPPVAEFVNALVKDLSMKAFSGLGGGGPVGYTHRWRGLVKDYLASL